MKSLASELGLSDSVKYTWVSKRQNPFNIVITMEVFFLWQVTGKGKTAQRKGQFQ